MSWLIERKCATKKWNPLKLTGGGPYFTRLFFTVAATMVETLQLVCEFTCQKVNSAKSKIYFLSNMLEEKKEALANMLGFLKTGRYVGFPIGHGAAKARDYGFL